MAQLTGFMNMTQIRKLTQEILKPIIQEIEVEMASMRKQSTFLKQQSAKTVLLSQKQAVFEDFVTCNKEDIRNIKIRLDELNDEDIKNMLNSKKQFTAINLQIETLKKQRGKFQEILLKQKKQNDRTLNNFNKYQTWMDNKVDAMHVEYLKLKDQTLGMTASVKAQYDESRVKYIQMQQNIQKHLEVNDKKYQILELYLRQRDDVKIKLVFLEQELNKYATIQSLQFIRSCQIKELQMNKKEIGQILDIYMPENIKKMLPEIEEKVKKIEAMSQEITDIKNNVFQSEQQINTFKSTTQSLQSNFRQDFRQMNEKITSNIEIIKNNVQIALRMDQKQTKERLQFQSDFSSRLHQFVNVQNKKVYQKINKQISERLQVQKKQDSDKIDTQQEQLNAKCEEMRQISDNIDKLLNSYNNRITKVRSDTQLFKEDILKEMRVINKIKQEYAEKFQDIGKVVASFAEIITVTTALNFHESQFQHPKEYGKDQIQNQNSSGIPQNQQQNNESQTAVNFSMSTYNDGLIYQAHPYNTSRRNNNRNLIIYRRKQMETPYLKKCLLSSAVHLIDRIYESYPYMDWTEGYRPSNFFKEQILQGYNIQLEKYGSWLALTAQRQNNNSKFSTREPSSGRIKQTQHFNTSGNLSTALFQRSKNSKVRHQETSPDGQRNSTCNRQDGVSFKLNNNIFNNLGETIDENIQIVVNSSRGEGNQFLMSDNDKLNIKRTMRTIHEVHPKDNANRFVLSGMANRSSISRENSQTVEVPQSAGSKRKRYTASRSKNQIGGRYDQNANTTTQAAFMTSRSSRRKSVAQYKM